MGAFAARLAADGHRPTVACIAAASHSGKSASVLVGFLHSSELSSGDVAQQNFTHYLYMPFANNGRNHEKVSEAKLESACGKSTKLRSALGAAYMRECFRAQAFSAAYAKYWQTPEHILNVPSCRREFGARR